MKNRKERLKGYGDKAISKALTYFDVKKLHFTMEQFELKCIYFKKLNHESSKK